MQIIERRMEFERDPEDFSSRYEEQQAELRGRIQEARELVGEIVPGKDVVRAAVRIPLHLDVDGHRADLTLIKSAVAYAAMQGRTEVLPTDVAHVAPLVMAHRMRRNPFQDSRLDAKELESWIQSKMNQ